jgi:hypothetical protein
MVTGFSQGASAALGLGRALQGGADHWFRLGALAPISGGAYDFARAALPSILDGELIRLNPGPQLGAKYSVLYTAYMLVAFSRLHPIDGMPGEIIKPAYARTIEGLFDGRHTGQQLFAGTPATLDALLSPYGVNLLRHPVGGLATALKIADSVCTGWLPRTPVRLYMATRDEQAVNANTWHCQVGFAAQHPTGAGRQPRHPG